MPAEIFRSKPKSSAYVHRWIQRNHKSMRGLWPHTGQIHSASPPDKRSRGASGTKMARIIPQIGIAPRDQSGEGHPPPDHPMVPWLVGWASDVVLKYYVHDDGRTAYDSMTGHRVKHIVAGFGKQCIFNWLRASWRTRTKEDGEIYISRVWSPDARYT